MHEKKKTEIKEKRSFYICIASERTRTRFSGVGSRFKNIFLKNALKTFVHEREREREKKMKRNPKKRKMQKKDDKVLLLIIMIKKKLSSYLESYRALRKY